jgi:flagellin-like hook-associated protein FlgL
MDGAGLIASAVTPAVVTAHGSGTDFDQQSGLQILNGQATHPIDLSLAVTVEDLLNTLNGSPAAVLAEINPDGTGIDVRSRLSGVDFAIGENGGTTATQLGLRTFTEATKLADLNFGRGVNDYEGPGAQAEAVLTFPGAANDLVVEARQEGLAWNGYTVTFTAGAGPVSVAWDPVAKQIDVTFVAGATTAADVMNAFNATPGLSGAFRMDLDTTNDGPNNQGQGLVAAGSAVTAGGSSANADFTITRRDGVSFEIDVHGGQTIGEILDLINNDPTNLGSGVPLVARLAASGNGIELVDNSVGPGRLTVTKAFSSTAAIDLGLVPPDQSSNTAPVSPGLPDVLTGADVDPRETEGLFTALLRLDDGLLKNDAYEIQRSIAMLDQSTENMNFARAELGARQQGLDALQQRLDSEQTELKQSMSQDYDADFVEVTSNLTARQVAYEAALRWTAQVSQMSLLSYL